MKRQIVAVIGESDASPENMQTAEEVGSLIAKNGWTLVTGGLGGVMEAASKGAAETGGVVVGILPDDSKDSSNNYVGIPIVTNMGHARNAIIAHTADAVIAVGGGFGTLSEIAIAKKLGKPVFGIRSWEIKGVVQVGDATKAIEACRQLLDLRHET